MLLVRALGVNVSTRVGAGYYISLFILSKLVFFIYIGTVLV